MTGYDLDEKIWTIEELESVNEFDNVICVECGTLFGLKSGGAFTHSKTHNKFYKYDSEKERKAKEIKEKQVEFTEENQLELNEKLNSLKKEAEKNNPEIYLAIKIGLSSWAQIKIFEETKPFALFFNGDITSKEITVNSIKKIPDVFYIDSFTSKSFVTHSARHSTKQLRDIDLLPKIQNKVMLTSNVDNIFSGNKPTVNDNIQMIDTVLEGKGYESHSAVHGVRGYTGNRNFVWLGTINQINKRVFDAIGRMNNKPLFFRFDDSQRSEKSIEDMIKSLNEERRMLGNEVNESVEGILKVISELFPNEKKMVMWDSSKDETEASRTIVNLSNFLMNIRAYIPTENTVESTSGGTNYNFGIPVKEDLFRLSKTLYNLARGHAIIHGRNYITNDDLEIVVHIVMSSIPIDRLRLFEVLLSNKGIADTTQVENHLSASKATALKEMKKLRVLEIVEDCKVDGKSKPTLAIKLKNEYSWILDNKFKQYLNSISFIHIVENSKLSDIINNKDNLEKQTMKVYDDNILSNIYSKY
jgi:hypothetical protein